MATRKPKSVTSTETPVTTGPVVTLAQVIEATKADAFVYTSPEFHNPLITSGDVEINPEMTDEYGNIATRAILNKIESQTPMTDTVATAPAASTKPVYEIKTGEIPAKSPRASTGLRAGRTPVYPFEQLNIGQYFFVANKGDKPAAKALASTVAGANARYVEEVEGQTRTNRKGNVVPVTTQLRKFRGFDTTETIEGVEVKGAKVFRVPLDSAE